MSMYVVYLDEFGHIGPYISQSDPQYNTHPAFGLAGIALPSDKVREFSSFFLFIKKSLFDKKIEKKIEKDSSIHSSTYEIKSSELLSFRDFRNSTQRRKTKSQAIKRILNKVKELGGFIIYVGIYKDRKPEDSNSKGLYKFILKSLILRVNEEMEKRNSEFMIVIDQQDDMNQVNKTTSMRSEIVRQSFYSMFGEAKIKLIEAPIQAESHLYQTLQCADWVCGVIGKVSHQSVGDNRHQVYESIFGDVINRTSLRSGIRALKVPKAVISDKDSF